MARDTHFPAGLDVRRPTRRALLFAPYFLPRRRVGSMRPFRFAIHLREFGWQPTIVTIAAPGQRLTEKEAALLEGIDIIELKSPLDRTARSESQLGTRKAGMGSRPVESRRDGMLKAISDAGQRALKTLDRQFPTDTWLVLFLARYPQLVDAVKRVNPDVIWATGDPWSSLVIARRLAKRFHIPFVADFRDPWTLSEIRTAGQWPLSKSADRRMERRVVRDADLVLFQASQVEAMYRRHYADLGAATATITNSFDPAVFDDPIDLENASGRKVSDGEGLRIGFFGRFRAMSPATIMIDALRELNAAHPESARHVGVHSFGPLSDDDAWYAEASGVASSFIQRDAVALQDALAVLRAFDILLVSTEPSRKQIIPAKLLEYIAAGRPILSFSRNPEVREILERTGTGIQLHDPIEIAALLASCLAAAREGRPLPIPFDPQPDEIMKYEARRTTRDLAAVFNMLVDPPSF